MHLDGATKRLDTGMQLLNQPSNCLVKFKATLSNLSANIWGEYVLAGMTMNKLVYRDAELQPTCHFDFNLGHNRGMGRDANVFRKNMSSV